jgi:hypothetical protein
MSDPTQATAPVTEADKIWAEIKDKRVNMYALPNQVVANYCTQAKIDPTRCFLLYKTASAIIPALEEAVGKAYTVEVMDKYIVVARAPASLIPGK